MPTAHTEGMQLCTKIPKRTHLLVPFLSIKLLSMLALKPIKSNPTPQLHFFACSFSHIIIPSLFMHSSLALGG